MKSNVYLQYVCRLRLLISLQIRSFCLAQDNRRAVVGGADGKIYIFDMHSGRLSRTLTSHATDVTGVKVTEKDDFLVTAG
jgi:WD40 repeat protein